MSLAETAGSRTLLVLSALGLAGAVVAAAVAPSAPAPAPRPRLLPMHGCAKAPAPVAPPVQAEPASLSGQLQIVRDDLSRCVVGFVDATLALRLDRDGHVLALELYRNLGARPDALRSCVTAIVKSAQFPASETEMRVEMLFASN
jgi:hypothetical protein